MSLLDPLRKLKAVGPTNFFRDLSLASSRLLNGMQLIPADYLHSVQSRYGHGKPPHPILNAQVEANREQYKKVLQGIRELIPQLSKITMEESNPTLPYWNNPYFGPADLMTLYYFMVEYFPRTYLEIGSGNSTKIARLAIRANNLGTKITSIDPKPRCEIKGICDRLIEAPFQDLALDAIEALEPGDILFLDGSHRVLQNSDVTIFFLEVLPILKPGVIVHVHDIFIPYDYPPAWIERYFSELYMLGQYLILKPDPGTILFPVYYVTTDAELKAEVSEIYSRLPVRDSNYSTGVSFWFEKR